MRMIFAVLAVLGTASVTGGTANAQSTTVATCISNGISYQVGEVACIPGCHGAQRLARCEAAAEAADWTTIAQQCPSARLTPVPAGSSFRPVVLACNLMPNAPFAQVQGDLGSVH